MATKKKPRVFVKGPSYGQPVYCGGPDFTEAMEGLRRIIHDDLPGMMNGNYLDHIEITVCMMTDAEVKRLPDVS